MKFSCSSCNASLTAQPEHAGRTVSCPSCGGRITVPFLTPSKPAGKKLPTAESISAPSATTGTTASGNAAKLSAQGTSRRDGWVEADPANPNLWYTLGIGVGIFAAIHLVGLLLGRTYIYTILFERGWVNFAESFVFSWGAGILILKYQKLKHQRNALLLDVLPDRLGREITKDNVGSFIDHVYKLPERLRDSLMVNRIRKALELFESRQNNGDVAHMMSTQSEIDSIRIAGSYSLLKVFIWAIPILGFVGTVLGLSAAIGNFQSVMGGAKDIDALMGSLGGVTSGLGTSFDTTLLGLVYSIILSFPMSGLQKTEEDNLNNIDAYCNETLLPRLNDHGGDAEVSVGDINSVLDRLVGKLTKAQGQYLTDLNTTSQLVREQVESLERRANEQAALVQHAFADSMQKLQTTTAQSLQANVQSVNEHVKALAQALTTLNAVLAEIGEQQVQVEVRPQGWFSRLFGGKRNGRRIA